MLESLVLYTVLTVPKTVVTTGYCAIPPCVSTHYADGITASGTKAQRGTCAADWRVYPKYSLWFVPGYGICRVEDTGNLVRGHHLDLFFDDIEEARQWGRRKSHVRRVRIMASEDNQQIELERLTEDNQTVAKWALDTFGKPNPLAVLRRLCDEVLEAMEICVTDNLATRTMFGAMRQGLENLDKYRLPDQELEKRRETIALELADAQIVAYHAEGVLGVDLPALVNRKMVINRNRRWKINADNTGQHIEETEE